MTKYILTAACPHCGEISDLVEETESPVALDREIPITTRWCPECGNKVVTGQWDLHEEHEIAHVTPSQELPNCDHLLIQCDEQELVGGFDLTKEVNVEKITIHDLDTNGWLGSQGEYDVQRAEVFRRSSDSNELRVEVTKADVGDTDGR